MRVPRRRLLRFRHEQLSLQYPCRRGTVVFIFVVQQYARIEIEYPGNNNILYCTRVYCILLPYCCRCRAQEKSREKFFDVFFKSFFKCADLLYISFFKTQTTGNLWSRSARRRAGSSDCSAARLARGPPLYWPDSQCTRKTCPSWPGTYTAGTRTVLSVRTCPS